MIVGWAMWIREMEWTSCTPSTIPHGSGQRLFHLLDLAILNSYILFPHVGVSKFHIGIFG
jgi:hypothetical protein